MRFPFCVYNMIAQLIFSRVIDPCPKFKTVSAVFPHLYKSSPISEDQVYDGLSFIGESYKKYIELFNHCYEQHVQRDFSPVFFDFTKLLFWDWSALWRQTERALQREPAWSDHRAGASAGCGFGPGGHGDVSRKWIQKTLYPKNDWGNEAPL